MYNLENTSYRFVEFAKNKRGEGFVGHVMGSGKVAFSDKKAAQIANPGTYICKVVGENPKGTVIFVIPLLQVNPYNIKREEWLKIGAQEKLELKNGSATLIVTLDGVEMERYFTLYVEALPEYKDIVMEYYKQYEQERREKLQAVTKQLETEGEQYYRYVEDLKPETEEVETDEYELQHVFDEDWGLHEADPGCTIMVVPVVNLVDSRDVFAEAFNTVCQRFGVKDMSWHDICEAAEDEAIYTDRGPNFAIMKLVHDEVARNYKYVTVKAKRLPPEKEEELRNSAEQPCVIKYKQVGGYLWYKYCIASSKGKTENDTNRC